MHVLHIVNNGNRGGAGFVILPLIEELSKKGVKFTVAYLLGPENMKSEYHRLGVNTVLLGKNPLNIISKLYNILFNKTSPVSLIHTHLVQASLIGRFMGRVLGIPVLTTRHYRERSKNNLLYILEDLTSKYSHKVIAISKAVHTHMIESNYTSPQRCKMIYSPINLNIFAGIHDVDLRSKSNIVFNGRFIELKGIKYLLEAFDIIAHRLPASRLVLMGRYEENNPILELVQKHRYRDRIGIKGFVGREEIIEELTQARIYVQPSLSEGLGLAAIEAMGLKCPCIFSEVGGLVELSQNGKNAILFPAQNSQLLADSILHLWQNIEKSERLGVNAQKFVKNNFDSTVVSEEYYEQYRSLAMESIQ